MLAGAAIAVVVVVVVLRVIVVAASGSVVVTSFLSGISSNIFGEAPSHFTRKWRARVDQEATTSGEFFFEIFVPVFGIRIGFAVIVKPFAFFGLGKVR